MQKKFKLSEVSDIAKEIIEKIESTKEREDACVLALSGDLGAGKTTLTQAIARALGVKESLVSPTFVLMKFYSLKHKRFNTLVHIDAYRIDEDKELLVLGWEAILKDPTNLVLIEWPERVAKLIPKNAINVSLKHACETTREIKIS